MLPANTTGMCGECSQWMGHTAPQGSVHFLSQSHSGSWLLCEGTVPGGPCVSWGQQVSDSNTPSRYELYRSQEHVVSDWQTAHSLVGTCGLWGRDCSGPLPITSPASLPPRSAINGSQFALLWYSLGHNPFLCEHARGHSVALESSREKGPLFFSVSLLFPQLGLLCHISPLRVSSGIQPMLTLRAEEAAAPLHPAPSHCKWTWECELLHNFHSAWILWWFFSPWYAALWDSKGPQWLCLWETFLLCGNFSSFTTPSTEQVSVPRSFVSLFIFIFRPTSFQRDWFAFLVSGDLCQCSEVVLWKLLFMQMIFWCICGQESGLFILFVCHFGTALFPVFDYCNKTRMTFVYRLSCEYMF